MGDKLGFFHTSEHPPLIKRYVYAIRLDVKGTVFLVWLRTRSTNQDRVPVVFVYPRQSSIIYVVIERFILHHTVVLRNNLKCEVYEYTRTVFLKIILKIIA